MSEPEEARIDKVESSQENAALPEEEVDDGYVDSSVMNTTRNMDASPNVTPDSRATKRPHGSSEDEPIAKHRRRLTFSDVGKSDDSGISVNDPRRSNQSECSDNDIVNNTNDSFIKNADVTIVLPTMTLTYAAQQHSHSHTAETQAQSAFTPQVYTGQYSADLSHFFYQPPLPAHCQASSSVASVPSFNRAYASLGEELRQSVLQSGGVHHISSTPVARPGPVVYENGMSLNASPVEREEVKEYSTPSYTPKLMIPHTNSTTPLKTAGDSPLDLSSHALKSEMQQAPANSPGRGRQALTLVKYQRNIPPTSPRPSNHHDDGSGDRGEAKVRDKENGDPHPFSIRSILAERKPVRPSFPQLDSGHDTSRKPAQELPKANIAHLLYVPIDPQWHAGFPIVPNAFVPNGFHPSQLPEAPPQSAPKLPVSTNLESVLKPEIPEAVQNEATVQEVKSQAPKSSKKEKQRRSKPKPWGDNWQQVKPVFYDGPEKIMFWNLKDDQYEVPAVPETKPEQEELRHALLRLFENSNLPAVPKSVRKNLLGLRFYPHMYTVHHALRHYGRTDVDLSPGGLAFDNFLIHEDNGVIDALTDHRTSDKGAQFFCKCKKVLGNKEVLCTFTAESLGKMRRHIKNHLGNKKWVCCCCQSQMTDQTDMARHSTTHTKLKPFECDLCGDTFTQKVTLANHMIQAHKTKLKKEKNSNKYTCRQCGFYFAEKDRSDCIKHLENFHADTLLVSLKRKKKFPFN